METTRAEYDIVSEDGRYQVYETVRDDSLSRPAETPVGDSWATSALAERFIALLIADSKITQE